MNIIFVLPGDEALGVEYISSILKQNGHNTQLVIDPKLFNDADIYNKYLARFFSFKKNVINEIINLKPDIVAFSVLSDLFDWAIECSALIKQRINVPIVFGGIHPTSEPDAVLKSPYVDFVIRGEGEYAMLDLVNSLENKTSLESIPNLCFKKNNKIFKNDIRNLIDNLDSLPFPDKELFYNKYKYNNFYYRISGSRGCPLACTYCNNSLLKKIYRNKGQYLRKRSVYNIITELIEAKSKYPIKIVEFCDEMLTYDKEWLNNLLVQYKEKINIPFKCSVHPNNIDEKTAKLLAESGCKEIEIGIQTINPNVRKTILNRPENNNQIINALNLINKYNIFCPVDMLFGLPGLNYDDHLEILKFFNNNRVDYINFYWLRYFPQTEICKFNNNINAYSEQKSFVQGGANADKKLFKIQNFGTIMFFLPQSFVSFLLNHDFIRFFPPITFPFILTTLSILRVQIFKRKMKIYTIDLVSRYKYYMFFKIKLIIKQIFNFSFLKK